MGLIAKDYFPRDSVTDRFRKEKISLCITINKDRIPLAVDQENEAIKKLKY
jgi:hypothetical protein